MNGENTKDKIQLLDVPSTVVVVKCLILFCFVFDPKSLQLVGRISVCRKFIV